MQEVRYTPVILDITDTFAFINRHLGQYHVEVHVVVGELLKELFDIRPGHFGRNEGSVGAFIAMAPRLLTAVELRDVEIFLNEALKVLCDEVSFVLPHLGGDAREKCYTFFGDQFFTFYQPITADRVAAELFARAFDENAVRNLVGGSR